MLEKFDINPDFCNLAKLEAEYQALSSQKSELSATYHNCEKEVRYMNRKLANLNHYLQRNQSERSMQDFEKADNKKGNPSL